MSNFLRMFAASLLLAAVAAPAPANAQIVVRMWTLLGGGDGERMRALVEEFNASQKDAKVEVTTLNWGEPFYTKVMTTTAVGAGPDLVTIHLSRMANLIGAQTVRALSASELATAGLSGSDFYPRLWRKAAPQGTAYAVPLDSHALVLYYNKELARRAGLLEPDGTLKSVKGMAVLTDAFRAVKEKTGMQGVTMESGPNSHLIWRLWLSLLAQRGATLINDKRFSYGKHGEIALAAVSDWFARGYASRGLDYPAATSQFISGKAGFMINGVWEVPSLVAAAAKPGAFEYGVVPLPQLYANASVWGDSHAFAVPNNAGKPVAPARLAATLKFVAFMGRNALAWAGGGHIPADVAVAESAPARALHPNASYARAVAANVVYDPDGWYAGAAGPLQTSSAKFLPAALSGQLTPARALSMFEAEAGKLLVRRQPKP